MNNEYYLNPKQMEGKTTNSPGIFQA